jgi:hypothetical protein
MAKRFLRSWLLLRLLPGGFDYFQFLPPLRRLVLLVYRLVGSNHGANAAKDGACAFRIWGTTPDADDTEFMAA